MGADGDIGCLTGLAGTPIMRKDLTDSRHPSAAVRWPLPFPEVLPIKLTQIITDSGAQIAQCGAPLTSKP